MDKILHALITDRDGLAAAVTAFNGAAARERISPDSQISPPSRGAIVGSWTIDEGQPFPDVIVVRDVDKDDTLAWLAAFLNNLSPFTQSTRILSVSEFRGLADARQEPTLGVRASTWVGAIIAECNVQAHSNVNLRELSGLAAETSSTFAAARSVAVWGKFAPFKEISARHELLSQRLRDGSRPISAQHLRPLWNTLAGLTSADAETGALRQIEDVLMRATAASDLSSETLAEITRPLAVDLGLPELVGCALGPQSQRVQFLDQLADKLKVGPSSPAIEAILGFGASLVDPGAAVLPELLRKHAERMPMAAVWLGAFAGAWAPFRVLTDFGGLGRLLAKDLLAPIDLYTAPKADVAFDEIIRWLGPSNGKRPPIRGMANRSITVELIPGVAAPVPIGRIETTRTEANAIPTATPRQEQLFRNEPARTRQERATNSRVLNEYFSLVDGLGKRVLALEDQLAKLAKPETTKQNRRTRK